MNQNVLLHRGDMGDVIAALPLLKAIGGGKLVIGRQSGKEQGRECMRGKRFEALRPLLEYQPYVKSVEWQDEPKNITHDLTGFRVNYEYGENLTDWQARYLGITVPNDPWLVALRSPLSIGRAVFARSTRYHNPAFPWHVAMIKHGKTALFVGTKEEHEAFEKEVGMIVEYCPTKDLLALAEIIAGCHLFVGNQSCPFWIAAGLGVNLVQECWPHSPNSQLRRANARYMIRGPFTL